MRLPLTWLKEFVKKIPDAAKLADVLAMHGLEVEEIIADGEQFARVVVGEIVGISAHPDADKLRVTQVLVEPKGSPLTIVCGAPNIEVGQKVPVALVGAILPNGVTIARRPIRGVESNGMLCAADELGLGEDHSGIMVLDAKLKIGSPFADAVGAQQEVMDITTPANRADLMSVRGLAWEIAAILGTKASFAPTNVAEGDEKNTTRVEVEDSRDCPFYSVRTIHGLRVTPSPIALQQTIRAIGMRPINNIVDTTNFIMWKYGQPLHAFDAAKITGAMHVRRAKNGETLVTLDGQTRKLDSGMIVIADDSGPIALAGVMGGQSTEVTESTTDIVLESAIFHPVAIRTTSRKLGLVSEASKRFEKGLWPAVAIAANDAAAAMLAEYYGGSVDRGMVQVGRHTLDPVTITLAPTYISQRLGQSIPSAKSKTVLTRLGFVVTGTAKEWRITVPEWRPDVTIPEDIVDEVGRMIGYEHLPNAQLAPTDKKALDPNIRFKEEVKNILVEMGFTEILSHAFYSEHDAERVQGAHFEIANPLDATQQNLRKSLLPQIGATLHQQADAGNDAKLFEIGLVFDPETKGAIDKQQRWKLAFGVTAKGDPILAPIVKDLQLRLKASVQPRTLTIVEKKVRSRNIEYCEFDLQELRVGSAVEFGTWDPNKHVKQHVQYRELSKYPAITRDISFWWPKEENALRQTLEDLHTELLRHFTITDRFTKDDRTSYAVSFIFQSFERTLTKDEVDNIEQKIKDALVKFGAIIR